MAPSKGGRKPSNNKYTYSGTGQGHLDSLMDSLRNKIYRVAELNAESMQKVKPIDVTSNDFAKAFDLLVSNPPRSKWYRIFHIIVTLFSGFGIALFITGLVDTNIDPNAQNSMLAIGALITLVSILVDTFLLDKRN
ncbi:hypothetical protein [Nitrospina watsonii]|uniref:hypothetical protein n=1 Tax=Nitrospina watsonii TaxID=1323948 RepID=UPI00249238F4|nr:hypothetical protein [Nitrospina watsonii]